jgi:hypothetical protein
VDDTNEGVRTITLDDWVDEPAFASEDSVARLNALLELDSVS